MSDLYTLRIRDGHFVITKFDRDFNVQSSYDMHVNEDKGTVDCTCPQAAKGSSCKHLDIFETFDTLYPERINTGWFFCHSTGDWEPPIETGEPSAPVVTGEVVGLPKLESHDLALAPSASDSSRPVMTFDKAPRRI